MNTYNYTGSRTRIIVELIISKCKKFPLPAAVRLGLLHEQPETTHRVEIVQSL